MKPSISQKAKNGVLLQNNLFCAAAVLLLLITSSASSQPLDSNPDSGLTCDISSRAEILDVSLHQPDHEKFDPELINKLVQKADAQSVTGEYESAIRCLEVALQASRIRNGLYHYSQIEIIDELIAIEALSKNWSTVNDLYELEEHLLKRLLEPTDARLEIGLEKITAWHIRAIDENIDHKKQEHLAKVKELLTIRLRVVENILGNDNARYDFISNNLAYAELQLEKFRVQRNSGGGSILPPYTPMSIE